MKGMISVIVPVYNVEKYLERCLDSIREQSYTKLQMILIDDGSSDLSGSICDNYKERDTRIEVIHKTNGGLSSARNAGLDVAIGDYIAFVDSDDWIEPEMLETMLEDMAQFDADMVVTGYAKTEDGRMVEQISLGKGLTDGVSALKGLLTSMDAHVWNRLYKKSLFDDVRFMEGRNYEDVEIMHKLLLKCRWVYYEETHFYCYEQRFNAITQTPSIKNYQDWFMSSLDRIKYLRQYKPELAEYGFIELTESYLALCKCFIYLPLKNYQIREIINPKRKIMKEELKRIRVRTLLPMKVRIELKFSMNFQMLFLFLCRTYRKLT